MKLLMLKSLLVLITVAYGDRLDQELTLEQLIGKRVKKYNL